jgi:hypothetical protein
MTTQARELAKLVSNSGDLNFIDDIALGSDGAVLTFGADAEITLTHVHNDGILLNATKELQFGDSGTHISQSADGVLNLTSDTEIELNATTLDINANVDISGTLTVAGNLDFGDAVLSNVGAVALDSISGDADANTSITFSGSDVITITTGGETQVTFNNGSILPTTDADIDLGSSSLQFKDAYFHGSVETDALTIGGVSIAETIADTVGAMVSSNTETNITVNYDDSDNTLDFVVGTLNQNTSGSAVSLANARTIHGVSFNGTADIDLSEEIQDTVGAMFSSNTETGITATYQDGDGTIDLVVGTLNQNTTGSAATLTTSRTIHGVGFDGSANIDLSEVISDTVGAMFSSNTETGIAATYQDADNTIDLVIGNDVIVQSMIADNAIDSQHYVDGSIDTAHIADDQITLAKMASGTDGNIISYDASGNPVAIATGSDGQVLTSTGAGSPPAFEDSAGTTINNNADNRVITGSGSAGTLEGEANLTFTGSVLQTVGSANVTRVGPIGQASGAVQTWNVSSAANTFFVPSDNNTIVNPGGTAVDGAIIQVEIAMGSTVYAIAWQNKFKFSGDGSTPTVTATANKTDIFTFRYNGTVWQEIGRVQNLAQTV